MPSPRRSGRRGWLPFRAARKVVQTAQPSGALGLVVDSTDHPAVRDGEAERHRRTAPSAPTTLRRATRARCTAPATQASITNYRIHQQVDRRRGQTDSWPIAGLDASPATADGRRPPGDHARAALRPRLRLRHHQRDLSAWSTRSAVETVLEGLIALAVVWFGWCAYTWLGNQAQADEGLLRVAMVVAMGGMFFVAISIPHAFEADGNAAIVLGRRLRGRPPHPPRGVPDRRRRRHPAAQRHPRHARRGGGDARPAVRRRRHRAATAQKWWWLAAVVADQLGVYVVRSNALAACNSASHFAERFGLIIIIAIGESIVAVGPPRRVPTSEADAMQPPSCVGWPSPCACGGCTSTSWPGSPRTCATFLGCRTGPTRPGLVHVHPLPLRRRHRVRGVRSGRADRRSRPRRRRSVRALRRHRRATSSVTCCSDCATSGGDERRPGRRRNARLLAGIPTLGELTTLGQLAVPAAVLSTLVLVEVWAFLRRARPSVTAAPKSPTRPAQ